MNWARILAFVTGMVDQGLLRRDAARHRATELDAILQLAAIQAARLSPFARSLPTSPSVVTSRPAVALFGFGNRLDAQGEVAPARSLPLFVCFLRLHVDHGRALSDPLLLGHRAVGDDVATGGAVLVMDRLQLRVHVGRAVHRAPLRVLTS
jgi:hypothetical protein